MATGKLPVSGWKVVVQQPTGVEDLMLQEAADSQVRVLFRLFERLVRVEDTPTVAWSSLAITDLETLLLMLRRETLGSWIRAETCCPVAGCRALVDVSFRIDEYLASTRIRVPRGVEKADRNGSYVLANEQIVFRVPNAWDLLAVDGSADPRSELLKRCIEPSEVSARTKRCIERCMESLAPSLSRVLSGTCPGCAAAMSFYFDLRQFVLRELSDRAARIYDDVHLLAFHYKWPEEKILALPRSRRLLYAEALRGAGRAA
jgi:hypothetical protein